MNQHMYNAAIVVHIMGITLIGGATLIDFLEFQKFWQSIITNRSRSLIILETSTLCQRLMGIGMGLIILSGIAMMMYMHAVWGQQVWFRIKFGLLLVVIANGLGIRRLLGVRLNKSIQGPGENFTAALLSIKRNMTLVHTVQFILFITIFILSVFKFN